MNRIWEPVQSLLLFENDVIEQIAIKFFSPRYFSYKNLLFQVSVYSKNNGYKLEHFHLYPSSQQNALLVLAASNDSTNAHLCACAHLFPSLALHEMRLLLASI